MSDTKLTKVRILQNDCEAYGIIEAKNGAEIEVAPELAKRMAISGHAAIVKNDFAPVESSPEDKKKK